MPQFKDFAKSHKLFHIREVLVTSCLNLDIHKCGNSTFDWNYRLNF